MLCEVQMALFSRSFIRKRIISAATTFVLTAASLALGQNPPAVHRVHPATMARPATAPQMPAEMPVLHASGLTNRTEWGRARTCDWRVHTFDATETSPPLPPSG
jgi:hypothetical protein